MRRNKIRDGWDAVPYKEKKFQKAKISWTAKYEYKHLNENTYFSKVIKFLIRFSLFFTFDHKNFTKRKINSTINNTYAELSSSKFKFLPSSVALYLFLSIIPIFIISTSLLSSMNGNWYKFLTEKILPYLIPGISDMFTTINLKDQDKFLLLVFLFSSIWFASKGINKFRDSFTEIYGYVDKQNFIIKRLKSIVIVVLISLYFTIIGTSFIPLMTFINNLVKNNRIAYEAAFYLITTIYVSFFGYIGIGLLFKFISEIKLKWSHINHGILTALIPIIIFILLFSTICKFLNYEKFGSIGSFLYLILFVLYISYFLHAGIIINSTYYRMNVYQNIVVKKSFITKKIWFVIKNIWLRIKFNRRH